LGVPFVTSYHTSFGAYTRYYNLGLLERPAWGFLRWFHNGGLRTFCPTDAVREELASHGFERLSIWGRGVDRARFNVVKRSRAMRRLIGADDDSVVVAYVGRIAKEKGLDHLLEAMHRVSRSSPAVTFAFAGDGPYLEHCRAQAPAGTTFLGRLEGDDLATFYASADLFLFPSSTDTFGNVLLEAMASGLPIVAADATPTREIARDAATYYAPDDPDALAASLDALANDAARRAARAAAGQARVDAFCWNGVFDRLVAEYEETTRDARRSSSTSRPVHRDRSVTRHEPKGDRRAASCREPFRMRE
jgi:phosphatidylinositol alpha 1,6-mannosyltransferase